MGTLRIVHGQGLCALEGLVCCLCLQVDGHTPTRDDGKREVQSRRSRPLEFGVIDLSIHGDSASGPLLLLTAMFVLVLTMTPPAVVAALRISAK